MRIKGLPAPLRAFIAELGLQLDDVHYQPPRPTWDGRTLHIRQLRQRWHLHHELGHWLAAPVEHRQLVNYGLGADPDTRIATPEADLAQLGIPPACQGAWFAVQEAAAAFLSGVLLFRFGPTWDEERLLATIGSAERHTVMLWQGAAHLESLGVKWWHLTAAAGA